MEMIDAISQRRSIRKYTDEKVSKEHILDILAAARLAPSAKNRQPWLFSVLEGKNKDKVADMMIEYTVKNDKVLENNSGEYKSSIAFTANIIKEAPILILAFCLDDKIWEESDTLSIGGAIQNICLRATDLGLGSLWIADTYCVARDIAKLFNHEDLKLISAISIGYKNQEPKMRPRKDLEEIIEWL